MPEAWGHKGHLAEMVKAKGQPGKEENKSGDTLKVRISQSPNSKIAEFVFEWYQQAAFRNNKLQFVYRKVWMLLLRTFYQSDIVMVLGIDVNIGIISTNS